MSHTQNVEYKELSYLSPSDKRYKVEPETKTTVRAKEKAIATKRVASEAGANTGVRVEVNAEVRDWDVGILTVVLNKVKAASNGLKRSMVGAKEETKEKA